MLLHSDNSPQVDMLLHSDNSPQVDMLLHSDTLSCFQDNQSLLFLLNAVWLAEKEQIIPIFSSPGRKTMQTFAITWCVVCSLSTFESSPLKPLGQMNRSMVESIYGRSSIKVAQFIPILLQTWPP